MNSISEALLTGIASLAINTKEVLTQEECAKYTGLSLSHIYALVSQRGIPHYKRGAKSYFRRSEIEEWMCSQKVYTKEENEARADVYDLKHKQSKH